MANQQLSFPGWSQLTEEQKLIVQDLLKIATSLEYDLGIIEEIILENSTNGQTTVLDKYQIIDSIDNPETNVEDMQEFARTKLKRKVQEKPPEVICAVCRALGKTDGHCADC